MTRNGNGRGRRGQTSEAPQPGSEQRTAPEQAVSRIRDGLSQSDDGGEPVLPMRLVMEEMLADPEVADVIKAHLPSPEDLAAALGKRAHDRQDHVAGVTAAYAKVRRWTLSGLGDKQDALWRRPEELEQILSALVLSHLNTAFALSVASRDRSSEATTAVAQNSVDIADALESIRETASGLLEGVEAPRDAAHVLDEAVEDKRVEELREAVAALSRRAEKQRTLVRRILDDRLVRTAAVGFLGEPRRPFSARLADMLVLTPRLEFAEFDPSAPAAFDAAGNALARALLDAREEDESRERASSLAG